MVLKKIKGRYASGGVYKGGEIDPVKVNTEIARQQKKHDQDVQKRAMKEAAAKGDEVIALARKHHPGDAKALAGAKKIKAGMIRQAKRNNPIK
jgi:hypothetical protein